MATLQARRQATNLVTDRKGKRAATVVHVVSARLISREPIQVRGNRPLYRALAKPLWFRQRVRVHTWQAGCRRWLTKLDAVVRAPHTGVEPSSILEAKCVRDEAKSTHVSSFDRDATLTVTRTSHPHDLTHNWASIRDSASWDMYTREMCQWPLCTATVAHEGVQPTRPAAQARLFLQTPTHFVLKHELTVRSMTWDGVMSTLD